MRNKLLQTLAACAWITAIIGGYTGYDTDLRRYSQLDTRIWLTSCGIALLFSLAAIQQANVARFARSNQALAHAVLSRPLNGGPPELIEVTGPHATVSLPDAPVQLHAARHKQRGRVLRPR